MSESTFNIERATNGLVLALFLAAALFLGIMLYYVLRDIDERTSEPKEEAQAHIVQPTYAGSSLSPRPQSASLHPRATLHPRGTETDGLVVRPLVRSLVRSTSAHCFA